MFQQGLMYVRCGIMQGIHFVVYAYRALSPLVGTQSCCRHTISCSEYFLQALQRESFFTACWATCKRIMRCNPFTQ